ncbi:SDR family NAD(P)-dependent oxidoreductase [Candidatus Foliamicus sp.]
MSNYDLSGKVALVTGAGRPRGLGEGIASRLAECGCSVLISDLGQSPGEHMPDKHIGATESMEGVAHRIRDKGGTAEAWPLDVRDESQVAAAVNRAVERFGRLDILVNNAGIGYLIAACTELPEDQWDAVLDVNLKGPFLCTKHAARQMIKQGDGGRIINIASQAAKSSFPHMAAYTASKHGLVGLTRTCALELGPHGITVNAVCPNHVTTGLGAAQNDYFSNHFGLTLEKYLDNIRARNPMRREGKVSDTANAVAFLCSEQAIYINGDSLNVTGGEEMH